MHFTTEEVETRDLDWFGLDQSGRIAHFASGGKIYVPQLLHKENMTKLNDYFRSQPETCTAKETEGWWTHARMDPRDSRRRAQYLEDLCVVTSRGLFSYDVTIDRDIVPGYYFRVAEPGVPLQYTQLPSSIRTALEFGFVYPGAYAGALTIKPIELGPLVE